MKPPPPPCNRHPSPSIHALSQPASSVAFVVANNISACHWTPPPGANGFCIRSHGKSPERGRQSSQHKQTHTHRDKSPDNIIIINMIVAPNNHSQCFCVRTKRNFIVACTQREIETHANTNARASFHSIPTNQPANQSRDTQTRSPPHKHKHILIISIQKTGNLRVRFARLRITSVACVLCLRLRAVRVFAIV